MCFTWIKLMNPLIDMYDEAILFDNFKNCSGVFSSQILNLGKQQRTEVTG